MDESRSTGSAPVAASSSSGPALSPATHVGNRSPGPTSSGSSPDGAGAAAPDRSRAGRFRRVGGRSWSQEIETTVAALRLRIGMIRCRPVLPPMSERERDAVLAGVESLLAAALTAAEGADPEYRRFKSWWRGTSIEAAFRKSHQAEAELARLYADFEVTAEIPAAVARVDLALNRDDPMRAVAGRLGALPPGPEKRALLAKVIQVGHEAGDGSHARLRSFRNILLSTACCIALLVLVFSIVVYRNPSAVPFCFHPGSTGSGGPSVACPSGDAPGQQPSGLDVVVVVLLGLLGGALSAAVSIRNVRGTSTPYDLPIALALLKVPAGALTAVGALIAIRGQFIPGLSELDTQEQILAYALVFGYAQQLLTGFIDRRAHGLLNSVPSKDAEQAHPHLPASHAGGPGTSGVDGHPPPAPAAPGAPSGATSSTGTPP